jgi:HEAT repeat protein
MDHSRNHLQLLTAATMFVVLGIAGAPLQAIPRVDPQTADRHLTPLQLEIERQRQRLSSAEIEERRDALVRLGSLHRVEAARVAASALRDPASMVRATAAGAALSLPPTESVPLLQPLLADKDEFVRQQVAYALGGTRSRTATAALLERLADKQASVRAAAAVSLGQIGDPAAVTALAALLNPAPVTMPGRKTKKNTGEKNPFVLRAVARALGEIRDRGAVPALLAALQNEQSDADLRREAAVALGTIGDSTSLPALREALTATDPYLSLAAQQAIRKVSKASRM